MSLMVHIMYKHGLGNRKDERVILKECHFYTSDNRCYNFAYVQHCFPLFYGHLEENNICTSIDIGFGQMVVRDNSKMSFHFNGHEG
jgi:hypothetical protein